MAPLLLLFATTSSLLQGTPQAQPLNLQPQNFVGSWNLETDPGAVFHFGSDGSFSFRAPSWNSTSSGRYEVRDGKIWLSYSEIDGAQATLTRPMGVLIAPDGSGFSIGKFRYVRKKA